MGWLDHTGLAGDWPGVGSTAQTTHALSGSQGYKARDPKCHHPGRLSAPTGNAVTWGMLNPPNVPHKAGQGLAGSALTPQSQNKTKLGWGRCEPTPWRGPCCWKALSPLCGKDARSWAVSQPAYLILAVQLLVRNVGRKVRMQESAEGQSVIPAAAEVCNVNILKEKKNNV